METERNKKIGKEQEKTCPKGKKYCDVVSFLLCEQHNQCDKYRNEGG